MAASSSSGDELYGLVERLSEANRELEHSAYRYDVAADWFQARRDNHLLEKTAVELVDALKPVFEAHESIDNLLSKLPKTAPVEFLVEPHDIYRINLSGMKSYDKAVSIIENAEQELGDLSRVEVLSCELDEPELLEDVFAYPYELRRGWKKTSRNYNVIVENETELRLDSRIDRTPFERLLEEECSGYQQQIERIIPSDS